MAKKATSSVTFVDTSKEAKKTMQGLSKTALRESGKVVRKLIRSKIASSGLVHSNRFKNHIGTWAFIDRQTGQPQLQVGFYSRAKVLKKGKKASRASPHWIEFGTKSHEITSDGHYMRYEDNIYGFQFSTRDKKRRTSYAIRFKTISRRSARLKSSISPC